MLVGRHLVQKGNYGEPTIHRKGATLEYSPEDDRNEGYEAS